MKSHGRSSQRARLRRPSDMSKLPRVSVLMTIYNAGPWLREAIESILAQTYVDWELIAIENGSTDESPAILASYKDSRIRLIGLHENMGRTPALRLAFDLARGEYIAILDADDLAERTRLQKQIAFMDTHGDVAVVGTWAVRIDSAGKEVGRWAPATDPAQLVTSWGSRTRSCILRRCTGRSLRVR